METLTERFMTMVNYLYAKYDLTPEEMQALNHFGYDLCKQEYDEDTAIAFFKTPVDEDGNPIKEEEKN